MHITAVQGLSTSIAYYSRAFLFFPSYTLSPSSLSSLPFPHTFLPSFPSCPLPFLPSFPFYSYFSYPSSIVLRDYNTSEDFFEDFLPGVVTPYHLHPNPLVPYPHHPTSLFSITNPTTLSLIMLSVSYFTTPYQSENA